MSSRPLCPRKGEICKFKKQVLLIAFRPQSLVIYSLLPFHITPQIGSVRCLQLKVSICASAGLYHDQPNHSDTTTGGLLPQASSDIHNVTLSFPPVVPYIHSHMQETASALRRLTHENSW